MHVADFVLCAVPVVRFVETEYTVSEGDGEVEVCLMIDGEISFSIVVRLFATPGTAEGKHKLC